MKKFSLLSLLLIVNLLFPQAVHANMAAPKDADIASSITFEKNEVIAVKSEVLKINVHGSTSDIVAAYKMKNTSNEYVSTQSMFLSPNIETSGLSVIVNGQAVDTTVERYSLRYNTEIGIEDWQYVVLSNDESSKDRSVDTVSFEMAFEPYEEYEVVVSYVYQLGGYPDYDFNAKVGRIEYYLTPAALWKDFEKLTIHLTLDKDMPVITDSSLPFEKIADRTYQYVSDTLPSENLTIVIDENWFQNIFSTLRSPYLMMTVMMIVTAVGPFVLLLVAIVLLVRWIHKKQ